MRGEIEHMQGHIEMNIRKYLEKNEKAQNFSLDDCNLWWPSLKSCRSSTIQHRDLRDLNLIIWGSSLMAAISKNHKNACLGFIIQQNMLEAKNKHH